jgi:thymidylate synthase (FAD)
MTSVRLVAISKPVIDECNTAEELIAFCARVSAPNNQGNHETAPKLLKYLADHQHWSPFELVSLTIEINTTRDIARQILRHRSFSFQEFSQRYAAVQELPVIREARLQDLKNRQNSINTDDDDLQAWWEKSQLAASDVANAVYQEALDRGIAKEVARAVLPEGMTKSKLYMAGTLRSFLHYVLLRTEIGTQLEHREVATQVKEVLINEFPSLLDLLN